MSSRAERNSLSPEDKRRNTVRAAVTAEIFGLFIALLGIIGLSVLGLKYSEYKNSDDKRTVEAMVVSSDRRSKKVGKGTRTYWKAELSYTVDGKEYSAVKNYDSEVRKGETVRIEIYHTKDGDYKPAAVTTDSEYKKWMIICSAVTGFGLLFIIIGITAAVTNKNNYR